MTTNKNNETIINTSITKKCREYFWNVTIENTSKNEMLKNNKEDHHFDAPECPFWSASIRIKMVGP